MGVLDSYLCYKRTTHRVMFLFETVVMLVFRKRPASYLYPHKKNMIQRNVCVGVYVMNENLPAVIQGGLSGEKGT